MIARAKEKESAEVEFDVRDMRELPVYGSFQLVWALNDAVNYLLGDDDLEAAFPAPWPPTSPPRVCWSSTAMRCGSSGRCSTGNRRKMGRREVELAGAWGRRDPLLEAELSGPGTTVPATP